MSRLSTFTQEEGLKYQHKGSSITLGCALLDGEVIPEFRVSIPLSMFNRHGLIAGATGTGKTKTIQVIAEQLSQNGVPCLLMDVKGDMSGMAAKGTPDPKTEERMKRLNLPWEPTAFPVELLTLSNEKGCRLRSTVLEFGPVLFSKLLELNDTQAGVVALVFKYCDDKLLPLLDLKDFKKVLQYLTNEGKEEIEKEYGRISTASTSTIIRKVIELEQQGADMFFGEPSFDPDDLMRIDENGRGFLNIIRLTDIQDKPKMFSTFMLSLLAEIYATFPEEGDMEQPKLVMFIDEAHLIFKEASNALLSQIETIIKLIRSKGVGVFFCTQSPVDIPRPVLAQLGLKVQHALRAFTAQDRKDIKQVAENYPLSNYYKTDELLTQLGIGEALITALNEKGIPTPLVHCLLRAPQSRMDVLTQQELEELVSNSALVSKYNKQIDRESAFEILSEKLKSASANAGSPAPSGQPSTLEKTLTSTVGKTVLRTAAVVLTRSLLGALGITGTSRRRKGLF
jgi:DNA helicase HerA-like ATPase